MGNEIKETKALISDANTEITKELDDFVPEEMPQSDTKREQAKKPAKKPAIT